MTILEACELIRRDIEDNTNHQWHYATYDLKFSYDEARKTNRRINQDIALVWIFQMTGDFDNQWLYGDNGEIRFSPTAKGKLLTNGYSFIGCNQTIRQAVKTGYVKPGDVVFYADKHGYSIYCGNDEWFNFDQKYSGTSGEMEFVTRVKGGTIYSGNQISYVLRGN